MRRGSIIGATALALAFGMPPLGQQAALRLMPGGITRVDKPPRKRKLTAFDIERIEAAQRKRERRNGIRLANWLWSERRRQRLARSSVRR